MGALKPPNGSQCKGMWHNPSMSKGARVQEPLVSESVSEGKVCPLFAQHDPPIYADHVAEIRLYRSNKRDERFELAAEDFYIDGEPEDLFLIDPYETTAQELQLQFGGGIFWVEAYRKPDGVIWKGSGRRLVLAGPSKITEPGTARPKGRDEGDEEAEEEEETEPQTRFAQPAASTEASYVNAIREEASQRARFAQEEADKRAKMAEDNAQRVADMAREDRDKTVDMHQMFAAAMLNVGKSNSDPTAAEERIRILRDENDSLRNRLSRDLDDLRQKSQEDLRKRDTHHEEAMRGERQRHEEFIRAERQRVDGQTDEMRSRHRTQEDELRRRWGDDVQEIKSRYEQQLSQIREERSAERMKLQNEQERDRAKYEEQVRLLQRENIDLEKKTNATEAALEALQNAPSGGPGFMDYLVRFAATPVGERFVAGALARAQAAAAAAAANADPAVAVSQQAPAQQTPEQAAPAPSPAPSSAPEPAAPQAPVFVPSPAAPTPWAPQPATQPMSPASNTPAPAVDATRPVATSTMSGAVPEAPPNGAAHAPVQEITQAAEETAA